MTGKSIAFPSAVAARLKAIQSESDAITSHLQMNTLVVPIRQIISGCGVSGKACTAASLTTWSQGFRTYFAMLPDAGTTAFVMLHFSPSCSFLKDTDGKEPLRDPCAERACDVSSSQCVFGKACLQASGEMLSPYNRKTPSPLDGKSMRPLPDIGPISGCERFLEQGINTRANTKSSSAVTVSPSLIPLNLYLESFFDVYL